MKTAKKTANAITVTESELDAIVDARIKERDEKEKQAKQSARDARKVPNVCHVIPTTQADRENNVLAKVLYVVPGVGRINGVACMVCHDGATKPRYGLSVNPIFGIPGDTATNAEGLIDAVVAKAKHAPELLAVLAKGYAAAAKAHTFVPRKRKEADREE